jgi:hypothetical protein
MPGTVKIPYGNKFGMLCVAMPNAWQAARRPLFHRRRGQAGEADDVTDRIDVRHVGLVVLVDVKPAAIVGPQSGRVQPQGVGRASPADAVQRLVGDHLLAAHQLQAHVITVIVVIRIDRRHRLAEVKNRPVRTQVIDERFHDLAIDERQQLRARVDERDAHAQRREDAGILQADDPGADHHQRLGQLFDPQQIVAGEDVLTVAWRKRVVHGRRADGDDDERGADLLNDSLRHQLEPQPVRIDERCRGDENVDAIAHQLMPSHVDLVADHVIDAEKEVAHRDVLLDRVRRPVDAALTIAGETQRRFAEGLAGNRAGVDAHAADNRSLLDDGDPLAEFGALDGGAVSGGAGADDRQVVVVM